MRKLKNCPFCGKDVKMEIDEINSRTSDTRTIWVKWIIRCRQCGCKKTESGEYYVSTDLTLLSKDKDEPTQMLIDEWNRRF